MLFDDRKSGRIALVSLYFAQEFMARAIYHCDAFAGADAHHVPGMVRFVAG